MYDDDGNIVWDAPSERTFETGCDHGILFPISGDKGVPWNGLISVAVDSTGGEAQPLYFDGLKYYDMVLAEDFQATLNVYDTPREFDPCEGIQHVKEGMRTYFNKRSKFNLCWRTLLGDSTNPTSDYKLHIAYNCTVQPAGRTYNTVGDSTTPNTRSLVITTTPACGRHSYYTFDSRVLNLSALENELFQGNLPSCSALSGLVDGGIGDDPDAECFATLETFDGYFPGETIGEGE